MLFAVICKDKPGALTLRVETRPAHVAHLETLNAKGALAFAGPFLGPDGNPLGSLVMLEATDKGEAEAIAASDPYAKAGLFETVEVQQWNWTFNKPAGA